MGVGYTVNLTITHIHSKSAKHGLGMSGNLRNGQGRAPIRVVMDMPSMTETLEDPGTGAW